MADKLYSEYTKGQAAEDGRLRKYEQSIKDIAKSDEPDDEGTRSKQPRPVQRELRKGK